MKVEGECNPVAHLPDTDGHNRSPVARLKEAGEMEFVLIILVVTLLVVLPLLFFVVMVGGFFDAVRRAFFGGSHSK